ncbi:COMM domain-containing protein 2-like [Tubulanus polymorphus]|uniref:COMM domain-containing protein 2-like n=1 Tax=Tubulanus polymorphus TaxID=672921 RepID=UPI003DA67178
MLLVLDDVHKKHLQYITSVDVNVLQEFCRMSLEFIRKGINSKVYQAAAQKLNVDVETVQHGIEGLMYLLSESSKLMVNEIDFHDSILTLGFDDELKKVLQQVYETNRDEIRRILSNMILELPHYTNLEWRLEVELASRSLRHQTNPIVTLKLTTEEYGETKTQILQTDPVNLVHLTNTLDAALQEMKTAHCRRIVRNIK